MAKQTQQPACRPSIKTSTRNYLSASAPSFMGSSLGVSGDEGGKGIFVADLEGGVGSFSLLIFLGHRGSEQLKKSSGSNPRRRRVTNRTTPAIANRPSTKESCCLAQPQRLPLPPASAAGSLALPEIGACSFDRFF